MRLGCGGPSAQRKASTAAGSVSSAGGSLSISPVLWMNGG